MLTALVSVACVIAIGAAGLGVATTLGGPSRCPPPPPVSATTDPLPPSPPIAITVPTIDSCSTLVAVGVDDQRRIEVPSVRTPGQAAWYALGPSPGQRGPAVVVGHINGSGQPGVFADLADVARGDRIAVRRQDGRTASFTVTETVRAPKTQFPTARVYGDTTGAELRLITCGGALDRERHDYADNVIVFASLAGWS